MSTRHTQNGGSVTVPFSQYLATLPTLADGDVTGSKCDANGVVLVNPGVNNGTPLQYSENVTNTVSSNIFTGVAGAKYLRIQNQDANNKVYLKFGTGPAVADSTCTRIKPGEDLVFEGDFVPTSDIFAITNIGASVVHILVGY